MFAVRFQDSVEEFFGDIGASHGYDDVTQRNKGLDVIGVIGEDSLIDFKSFVDPARFNVVEIGEVLQDGCVSGSSAAAFS